jgi:hypothetical protein
MLVLGLHRDDHKALFSHQYIENIQSDRTAYDGTTSDKEATKETLLLARLELYNGSIELKLAR